VTSLDHQTLRADMIYTLDAQRSSQPSAARRMDIAELTAQLRQAGLRLQPQVPDEPDSIRAAHASRPRRTVDNRNPSAVSRPDVQNGSRLAAQVAKQGFEALMAGKDKFIAGSLKTKAQGHLGKVLPDSTKAAMHSSMGKPTE
jgi:hypothetical protein